MLIDDEVCCEWVSLEKLEEDCLKIRRELNNSQKSNTKLYVELLKIQYRTTRSYYKEIKLFINSNKSDEYKRRLSLVSKVYSLLCSEIKIVAQSSYSENKQQLCVAANDDVFLGAINQDRLLTLKNKLSYAKALLGVIFCLYELDMKMLQQENSEAYSEALLMYLKIIQWFIDMGLIGLGRDWSKEKPVSKKLFNTLINTMLQKVDDLKNTVHLYGELKKLEPVVAKFNSWNQSLTTNQKKATKASTKYDMNVKNKWAETARELKQANRNLSISTIAKKIAENQPGSQETIRKYLATRTPSL